MKRQENSAWVVYAVIALAALGFPLAALGHIDYCVLIDGKYPSQDCSELSFWQRLFVSSPNEIGDTLAGVFGSLAFLAAAVAVFMQSRELAAQREELRLTREQFIEMNDTMHIQSFDTFFFQLVATHNSIVNGIDIKSTKDGKTVHEGRDSFAFFFGEMERASNKALDPNSAGGRALEEYGKMYQKHRADLAHYFRFVHNSMRAIVEAEHSGKKHKRLFRALFSDEELLILFYNGQTKLGENMVQFFEEFALFNNLPKERLICSDHERWYNKICFGETK